MKSIYIPRGESRSYESIVTDYLVVDGCLQVTYGVEAKYISGRGVIVAGSVHGDVVSADEIETTTIVCEELLAKRVSASEIFASRGAVVTCFLTSAYVETPRLVTALCEINEVKAEKIIHLSGKGHSMLVTLILASLRTFWVKLTVPRGKSDAPDTPEATAERVDQQDEEVPEDDAEADAMRRKIAETVREILAQQKKEKEQEQEKSEEDFELKRIVGIFKLLRQQGYTLRIEPGTPEENAPLYDFEKGELTQSAA